MIQSSDKKMPANDWRKRYSDNAMLQTVLHYIAFTIENGTPTSRRSSIMCAISNSFATISLNSLSENTALNSLSFAKTTTEYREALLFIIYLCESGFCTGERIQRLVDFKSYIKSTAISLDKITFLLNDKHYDQYQASPLKQKWNTRKGPDAYFLRLMDGCTSDSDDFGIIEEYFYEYKASFSGPAEVYIMNATAFRCAVTALLGHSAITSLTSSEVFDAIVRLENEYSKQTCSNAVHSMFKLLENLCVRGLITDPRIAVLADVSSKYSNLYITQAKDILSFEHPEYWCLYSYNIRHESLSLRYINISCPEVRNALSEFLSSYGHTDGELNWLCQDFETSFPHRIEGFHSFDFESYKAQLKYFNTGKRPKCNAQSMLTAFYIYIYQNYNTDLFRHNHIPNEILLRRDIVVLINAGYSVEVYNPLEDVPKSDKWILCYHDSRNDKTISTKAIDFTETMFPVYRSWIKQYIWNADVKVQTKLHPYPLLREALNYIYKIKTGKVRSFLAEPSDDYMIFSVSEINAYRNNILNTQDNNCTRNHHIYAFRNLLRFLSDNKIGVVESTVFYNLTHPVENNSNNSNPLSDDDLCALVKVLKRHAEEDYLSAIYYGIFYLALETEFREKTILSLPKDCLKETVKKGEYVLVTDTKTSAEELQEQPITAYVAKEVKELLALTDSFRQNCTNTSLSSRLIIIPALKTGMYRKVYGRVVNKYLASCCEEAGLKRYTMANLRDTHMTNVERYRIKESLSEMEQSVLSGHRSSKTDDKYYVNLDIREMLESVHGVIIGNVDLSGEILVDIDPQIATNDNEVSNGCGYCKSPTCNVMSCLDCLMCHDFVTTPDRLPFFESQLQMIDNLIEKATIPHDKEDFVSIKRLLLKYIEAILTKKEEGK